MVRATEGRERRLTIERRVDDVLNEIFAFRSDARVLQLFDAHHVLHVAIGAGPIQGIEPLRARLRAMWRMFGASSYDVRQIVAEGDQAYARVVVHVKHTGAIEIAGKTISDTTKWLAFSARIFMRWRADGSRLVETWVEGDFFQTLLQIGVLDLPGLEALVALRDANGEGEERV